MFTSLELSVMTPAFLVGVLVVLTHVPLGIEVFKRGIIFIDIAISQFAALGTIFASQYLPDLVEKYHFTAQIFAFLFAIMAALFFSFTDKKFVKSQEAIIGCSFIFSTALSMIILSSDPHGAEDFQNILAGQILWSSFKDAWLLLALYLPILVFWFKYRTQFKNYGFYLLFALVITSSVQIIGVYLVFSFLILPAFIASNFISYKKQIICAYTVAILGLIAGLILSNLLDYPTGPTISITIITVVIIAKFIIKKGPVKALQTSYK